jgi:MFS family permease
MHTWTALAGLRALVGVFEAGLFPGAVYLISVWYRRYKYTDRWAFAQCDPHYLDEVHKRYSSFYLISVTGSLLSGILAYGFAQMGGLANLAPWRWIFIMEGLLTCGKCISFVQSMLSMLF